MAIARNSQAVRTISRFCVCGAPFLAVPLLPAPLRLIMVGWLLKIPYADHEIQEKQTRESGLDWTIARPGRLTNGAAKHRYVATKELKKVPNSISRADVAHFMVEACEKPEWSNSAVQLGG